MLNKENIEFKKFNNVYGKCIKFCIYNNRENKKHFTKDV